MTAPRTIITMALVGLLASTPLRADETGGVIVQEKQGTFRVMARFLVPESPAIVLQVLTDYERIPQYLPDVKVSIVRSRVEGRVLVEQEAQKRLLMFSKRVHLLLDIREDPDALVFTDTSGRSFTNYEGSWRVVPTEAGTLISYQLTARPAFEVPAFVLARLLRRDAAELVDRMQKEIAAHASSR